MTRSSFKRSGGFIGRRMMFELNLTDLPMSSVRTLARLVREAQFFDLPENLIKRIQPDEYQCTITIDAGITSHTVRTNDSTMPGSLRPMIREIAMLGNTQEA